MTPTDDLAADVEVTDGPSSEHSAEAVVAPPPSPTAQVLLLASVFAVATCGLVYQLVAGAISSYLFGDAVTQFSLVIGVFLSAMGIGSFFSQYIHRNLLATFVELEIWIGLVGGSSSLAMFAVSAYAGDIFAPFFYCLCGLIGIMVGLEIPLLVRILGGDQKTAEGRAATGGAQPTRDRALSQVLALDYIGALAGSLLFPFFALPWFGLSRASVVFGIMNLAVAAAGLALVPQRRFWQGVRLTGSAAVLAIAFFFSAAWIGFLEDRLYQDQVVVSRDTPYQRIVVTRWRDDIRLFLNGHLQFSSVDEARYHEALVIPAMSASQARHVLVLGGGDGLAVRELLKYPSIEHITLVDIDPEMTRLAASRPELTGLNGGSLESPKLKIVHQDAMGFLEEDRTFYQAILVDLPDPSTLTLAKLYSRSFYALAMRRLSESGVLVTQATSPFFARQAFWCVASTVESVTDAASVEVGLPAVRTYPYRVHVPSFGEWGFIMAARHEVSVEDLKVDVATRFLDDAVLSSLFVFGKDIQRVETEVNRLDDPVLHRYYQQGWKTYNE